MQVLRAIVELTNSDSGRLQVYQEASQIMGQLAAQAAPSQRNALGGGRSSGGDGAAGPESGRGKGGAGDDAGPLSGQRVSGSAQSAADLMAEWKRSCYEGREVEWLVSM